MSHKWYIVHTYSGYEAKAKQALEERIRNAGLQDQVSDVVIPQEQVLELVRGERRTSQRKFYPGYMLVHMDLNPATWHLVKNTPKITGFVGGTSSSQHGGMLDAPALTDEEYEKIVFQMREGVEKPKPKVKFGEGESVRIIDGPFSSFNGVVDDVNVDKGKVKVLVSIFGRQTPVELDFIQVEKN